MREPEDPVREDRIIMDIIVDCYDEYEQRMGWSCYLSDRIEVPIQARCLDGGRRTFLRLGEEVTIVEVTDEGCDMVAYVEWSGREGAVPLEALELINPSELAQQAIEDWHYWVRRGYQLC